MRQGEVLLGILYLVCIISFACSIWEYGTGKSIFKDFFKNGK